MAPSIYTALSQYHSRLYAITRINCQLSRVLLSNSQRSNNVTPCRRQTSVLLPSHASAYHTSGSHSLPASNYNASVSHHTPTTQPQSVTAWHALGLSHTLVQALHSILPSATRPTQIQSKSIPTLLQRHNTLIGSHTGSGKTLAYLLPIMQLLKQQEQAGVERRMNRPRCLVITPTRELALQITSISKQLSHTVKLRVGSISGGSAGMSSLKKQRRLLDDPVDLIVGTVGRMQQLVNTGELIGTDVRFVVLDEADTLCDPNCGFTDDLQTLLHGIRMRSQAQSDKQTQFVAVGASLTPYHTKQISKFLPSPLVNIATSTLHHLPRGLQQHFVPVGSQDKLQLLGQTLRANQPTSQSPAIIFCNTLASCRAVDYYLVNSGYSVASYHGGIPAQMRSEFFQQFLAGEKSILLCTDIAARGLDITTVDHVIMFDFPLTAVDYLHRAGRTARQGSSSVRGQVTSLVIKSDRTLADAIQRASESQQPIHTIAHSQPDYNRSDMTADRSARKSPVRRIAPRPVPPNRQRSYAPSTYRSTPMSQVDVRRSPRSHSTGRVLGRLSRLQTDQRKQGHVRQQATRRRSSERSKQTQSH